jgi:hypothetical protein
MLNPCSPTQWLFWLCFHMCLGVVLRCRKKVSGKVLNLPNPVVSNPLVCFKVFLVTRTTISPRLLRSLHGFILDHVTHTDDSFPVGNGPWLNKERMAATNPKIWARRRKQILLSYIRQSRSALNTPRHCSTLLSHIFQAWEDPRSQ